MLDKPSSFLTWAAPMTSQLRDLSQPVSFIVLRSPTWPPGNLCDLWAPLSRWRSSKPQCLDSHLLPLHSDLSPSFAYSTPAEKSTPWPCSPLAHKLWASKPSAARRLLPLELSGTLCPRLGCLAPLSCHSPSRRDLVCTRLCHPPNQRDEAFPFVF